MGQQDFAAFGGGIAETAIHPLALALLLVAALFILVLPRKYVIVPVLLAVFLIPMGNVLVVAGVHIMPVRMIALVGWIRLVSKKLSSQSKVFGVPWNNIDKAVLCWACCRALAFILLWREVPAVVNQAGFLWSSLGIYFLLRFLIQDDDDIQLAVKLFVLIAAVNGAGMAFEHFTGLNLFGLVLRGVSPYSDVREGTIRAQGAFGHSILAGTFGGTLIPVLFWLWKSGRAKGAAALGFAFASVMVVTTGSSTPLLAYVAAVTGLCFWPLRGRMRLVRRCIVGALVGTQLMMKAPVWFVLNHVNIIGGSSGYHRSMLVDAFFRHFWDWWLLGVKGTADWGWDMFDLANQFVAEGEVGGLATFIFFILIIKRAFSALGTARRTFAGDQRREWLLWSLGATLFAYIAAFFGISLWDQTQVAWLALFAIIGAASFAGVERATTADGKHPAVSACDMDGPPAVAQVGCGMWWQDHANYE